jgi:hypothetical protein
VRTYKQNDTSPHDHKENHYTLDERENCRESGRRGDSADTQRDEKIKTV